MYIHPIALAYLVYAISLMWLISHMLLPEIRKNPVFVLALWLSTGSRLNQYLLGENPLAGFRDTFLIVLAAQAVMIAIFMGYTLEDPAERRKMWVAFLVGIANLTIGLLIGFIQRDGAPEKLILW